MEKKHVWLAGKLSSPVLRREIWGENRGNEERIGCQEDEEQEE